MNKNLSLAQKIHMAEACQEIEQEYAMHAYAHADGSKRADRSDEKNEHLICKWVNSCQVTATHSYGCMVGFERLHNEWGLGLVRQAEAAYNELVKVYPEVEGMESQRRRRRRYAHGLHQHHRDRGGRQDRPLELLYAWHHLQHAQPR